jgi:hypothetical protein
MARARKEIRSESTGKVVESLKVACAFRIFQSTFDFRNAVQFSDCLSGSNQIDV